MKNAVCGVQRSVQCYIVLSSVMMMAVLWNIVECYILLCFLQCCVGLFI